jgi:hypothetical protein
MKAGVWNLGFGLIAIVAAFNGYVLPFTNDYRYLVGAGVAIAALGVFQLWRNRGR